MEDAEFLLRLKAGDRRAFSELVDLHRIMVLNVCYRFLLDHLDAEDVAQEVFIEVFHGLSKFKGDSKLSTWICRIAITRSLDEIRKRKRKKRISSIGKTLGLEMVLHLSSAAERPDTLLEEKEDYDALMEALDKLPENQRVALALSKMEAHSNAEIAAIMQTSLTAVDSLIYRAKQNLKGILNS